VARSASRPAFYALAPGGWRDYATLLHLPYTAWHLAYVAIGAALAPRLDGAVLGWTLAAFALAVGVAAHCLDELHGRPLETRVPARVLVALAAASLAGACAIGLWGATREPWLLVFVPVGAIVVLGYNLELGAGRLHTDGVFALAWGGFPVLVAYVGQTGSLSVAVVLAALAATALSAAQRTLSRWARALRRHAVRVEGAIDWDDGTRSELGLGSPLLAAHAEAALRTLAVAVVLLAAALVAMRL